MRRFGRLPFLTAGAMVMAAALASGTPVPEQARSPAAPGLDLSRLSTLDAVIADAISNKQLPGVVVLVGRGDRVLFQKAYGDRALVPSREPMTLDTMFDLASLTKPVATATAVMMLVEDGRIRLSDRAAQFIPEFGKYGKDRITIRDLLTHMSGLRPDVDVVEPWTGADTAIKLAAEETPTAPPGQRFVYSDINFFLLAEVVARVARQPFDQFVAQRVFQPLGMRDTMFKPPASLTPRIAPTQACTPYGWPCEGADMRMLRGTVHDPTARRMGGVAGDVILATDSGDSTRAAPIAP